MNTYATKPSDIERKWYVVDAEGVVLGRMAAQIAKILQGKNKPSYVPNLDCGDYVVVINADKVKLTGKKLTAKKYFKHTGWRYQRNHSRQGIVRSFSGKSCRESC